MEIPVETWFTAMETQYDENCIDVIWKFQSSEKSENGKPRRLAELLQTIITEIMPSAG